MIIIPRQKSFSEKKETANQKSERRKLAAGITMIGAGIGSTAGIQAGLNDSKKFIERADEKLKKANAKDKELMKKVGERAEELVRTGKVDSHSMNQFLHEKAAPILNQRREATNRFAERAGKIAGKRVIRKAGKGLAIGTAVGGGVGAVVNKKMKDKNNK